RAALSGRAAAGCRVARTRHARCPEAVDLGARRGGPRGGRGRAAATDRPAAAGAWTALGAGPEAGGPRGLDRASAVATASHWSAALRGTDDRSAMGAAGIEPATSRV